MITQWQASKQLKYRKTYKIKRDNKTLEGLDTILVSQEVGIVVFISNIVFKKWPDI
jgi:adenosyl cobinamide kinase/adenosyl cobinamide phosphate guanylyltransferase